MNKSDETETKLREEPSLEEIYSVTPTAAIRCAQCEQASTHRFEMESAGSTIPFFGFDNSVDYTVTEGTSTTTLLGWSRRYDRDGNQINKNPNKTTTSYICSNGHEFVIAE